MTLISSPTATKAFRSRLSLKASLSKRGKLLCEHLDWSIWADVGFGSKAALTARKSDFSFTTESGLNSDIAPCPKSAKPGSQRTLFDHLVGVINDLR